MYGLCDCNNFFVSCERVFDPSLEGRAVVVLSGNDGCIIARSEQAKALGLKMGQPLFQARQIIERGNVAIYSSNFQLYGDMSHRVMQTLRELAPMVEVYSIDEAFLNLDGFDVDSLQEYGRNVARTVRRNTGIPVSLGIAPTKTLAKVASKLCKQYPRLEGCCVMHRPQDITKVLSSFPIEDIWGIGRRYSSMLKGFGVRTAEDFRRLSPEWVKAKMSVVGLRTWQELHGHPCIEFEHGTSDKQSIMVSRSFAEQVTDLAALHESLSAFVATAARKLRGQKSVAGRMQVFICTNRHRDDLPQHYQTYLVQFPTATDSTLEMVSCVAQALRVLFKQGYEYKKAGVILSDIHPHRGIQSALFDEIDRPKHAALMKTIDSINDHHGPSVVRVGSEGDGGIKYNRDHLSPLYTTAWSDILVVKV